MFKIEIPFLLGLVLITLGIVFIYWPVAIIFAGTAICTIAYKVARFEAGVAPSKEVK